MNESPNQWKFFLNETICCSIFNGFLDICILKFKSYYDFTWLIFSYKKF